MAEIIVTGGTFDKDYNPKTGELVFPEDESSVHEILKRARAMSHTVRMLMMIDSLDMTSTHRELVARLCQESPADAIVVTHGTDTMRETARTVQDYGIAKTIVFTGAMRPHKLGESDAAFNLGFALATSQVLSTGVHIAMNGEVFDPRRVRKNKSSLLFEQDNQKY